MSRIDAILNKVTMYKVMAWGLTALVLIADGLAWAGLVGIGPVGLLLNVVVLFAVCWAVTAGLARLLRVPYNSESWTITALILTCILPTSHDWRSMLYVALAGAVASASKYILVWRQHHIFNPAAIGALVLGVTGLLGATWWIATPWLTPFTVLLGLLVLRKQRQFWLFGAFAVPALVLIVWIGAGVHHQLLASVLRGAVVSWPIIFAGSIMLTEPTTLPAPKYYQRLFAVVAGLVFASQLHFGTLASTPELAIVVANALGFAVAPSFGVMLRLKSTQHLADEIIELTFEKPKNFAFRAGQYMEFTLAHPGADVRGNRRIFSLASAPSEPVVRLATRLWEPGSSFKKALQALRPGDTLRAAHVAGDFVLPPARQKLLFVAGGIGITPFRGMISELIAHQEKMDVILLYSASKPELFVYRELFEEAEKLGLRVHYVTGQLERKKVQELVPDTAERLVYVSGPDAMVTSCAAGLRQIGVPRRQMRTDHFSGY